MPFLNWQSFGRDIITDKPNQWRLAVGRGKHPWTAAMIWKNSSGYVWHTFNRRGTGGENDSSETLEQAQALASLCVIRQGFV